MPSSSQRSPANCALKINQITFKESHFIPVCTTISQLKMYGCLYLQLIRDFHTNDFQWHVSTQPTSAAQGKTCIIHTLAYCLFSESSSHSNELIACKSTTTMQLLAQIIKLSNLKLLLAQIQAKNYLRKEEFLTKPYYRSKEEFISKLAYILLWFAINVTGFFQPNLNYIVNQTVFISLKYCGRLISFKKNNTYKLHWLG